MHFLFLLPVILSILWGLYLQSNGFSLKQGMRGFYYIIGGSAILTLILSILLWLTR